MSDKIKFSTAANAVYFETASKFFRNNRRFWCGVGKVYEVIMPKTDLSFKGRIIDSIKDNLESKKDIYFSYINKPGDVIMTLERDVKLFYNDKSGDFKETFYRVNMNGPGSENTNPIFSASEEDIKKYSIWYDVDYSEYDRKVVGDKLFKMTYDASYGLEENTSKVNLYRYDNTHGWLFLGDQDEMNFRALDLYEMSEFDFDEELVDLGKKASDYLASFFGDELGTKYDPVPDESEWWYRKCWGNYLNISLYVEEESKEEFVILNDKNEPTKDKYVLLSDDESWKYDVEKKEIDKSKILNKTYKVYVCLLEGDDKIPHAYDTFDVRIYGKPDFIPFKESFLSASQDKTRKEESCEFLKIEFTKRDYEWNVSTEYKMYVFNHVENKEYEKVDYDNLKEGEDGFLFEHDLEDGTDYDGEPEKSIKIEKSKVAKVLDENEIAHLDIIVVAKLRKDYNLGRKIIAAKDVSLQFDK